MVCILTKSKFYEEKARSERLTPPLRQAISRELKAYFFCVASSIGGHFSFYLGTYPLSSMIFFALSEQSN